VIVAGLIVLILLLMPGGRESTSFPLRVEVRADHATATCSDDGFTYSSVVALRIHLLNDSGATLILAKRFEAAPWYRAATSIEDAQAGRFQYRFDGHEYWPGEWRPPKFGKAPDEARFELLAPGAATERVVSVYVLSTDSAVAIGGFTSAGATYVLQTAFRTWPYLPMSEKETRAIAKRWEATGALVTDTRDTPLVSITIPAANGRCGSK
jgi:hypothetical protein